LSPAVEAALYISSGIAAPRMRPGASCASRHSPPLPRERSLSRAGPRSAHQIQQYAGTSSPSITYNNHRAMQNERSSMFSVTGLLRNQHQIAFASPAGTRPKSDDRQTINTYHHPITLCSRKWHFASIRSSPSSLRRGGLKVQFSVVDFGVFRVPAAAPRRRHAHQKVALHTTELTKR
jgi:hypothetical protein